MAQKSSKDFFLSLLVALTLAAVLSGCKGVDQEEKSELQFFQVDSSVASTVINNKGLPRNPDLSSDKTLINRDYPIEVALYKDGRWFYDLPNLDTGVGTWKMENGMIKLFAKRRLFDMHIDVVATKEKGEKWALKFRDRFGPQILSTEKINWDQ